MSEPDYALHKLGWRAFQDQHIIDGADSSEETDRPQAASTGLAAPARPAPAGIVSPRDPFEDIAAGH